MRFPRHLPATYNEALASGATQATKAEIDDFIASSPGIRQHRSPLVDCRKPENAGKPCLWTTENGRRRAIMYCVNGECSGAFFASSKEK